MESVEIREFGVHDMPLAEEIVCLLGQLTSSSAEFTAERLAAIAEDKASRLWILYANGCVAGMVAMGLYMTPTGRKAWIEDVVVDEAYRGRGYGRMLVERAVAFARENAPLTLMLTSRPSREAANALYRSEGFDLKETNVYKMTIKK